MASNLTTSNLTAINLCGCKLASTNWTPQIDVHPLLWLKYKANIYFVRLFLNKPLILLLMPAEHNNLVAQQTLYVFLLNATLSKASKYAH